MTTIGLLDNLLDDPILGISSSEIMDEQPDNKMDLLSASLQESGLLGLENEAWNQLGNDALLDSILTGNNGADDYNDSNGRPLSDTSSDSGCNIEQQLLSPDPSIANNLDLIEYISNHDTDEEDASIKAVVDPRTNSPQPQVSVTNVNETMSFDTGATTIILPSIAPQRKTVKVVMSSAPKRRRVSQSSSDSGLDDISTKAPAITTMKKGKYPALDLTSEEKRICEREGIKLPSHYPLSREEERNLKRIRRKIRNKVSAQDSRKRKKEYMENMEDRVRQCSEENDELHKRIAQLESQNKTLASQLKRVHQIIISGGFTTRQSQTSTAMMVLLLSTALFLIPGLNSGGDTQQESQKSEIDITQAIKFPPVPGQSRSLLHFTPAIKEEFNVAENAQATLNGNGKRPPIVLNGGGGNEAPLQLGLGSKASPYHDHDYVVVGDSRGSVAPPAAKKQKVSSYIDEDVPPQGYGFVAVDANDGQNRDAVSPDNNNVMELLVDDDQVLERRLNVNVSVGAEGTRTRTVVLHVPNDI